MILADVLSAKRLAQITAGYDKVMRSGPKPDFKIGTTTTRLYFLDCLLDFEDAYQQPALLAAVAHLIGEPFKLSSLLGRTLRAGSPAQDLHRDIARNSAHAPMAGFILMLDPFRSDNGPTRFIPGSHNWPDRSLLANALHAIVTARFWPVVRPVRLSCSMGQYGTVTPPT